MNLLKSKYFNRLLWCMLILSPILSGWIISLVSQTSIVHLDAWNTTWNDEVGYYNAVRIMRTIGFPKGFGGYNEIASRYPSFGAYNYFTYIPYVLMSFITGISSHNFIVYCNVLMISAAYLFLIILLRPSVKQTMCLIIFECFELIHARYIWSGMSEVNSIFATIIVFSCFLWILRQEKEQKKTWKINFILMLQIVVILFYGVIRPFLMVYFILVIFGIKKSHENTVRKGIKLAAAVMALAGSMALYFFMQENCCAQYFAASSADGFFSYIKNGQFLSLVKYILKVNGFAVRYVRDQLRGCGWIGLVTVGMFLSVVIMLVSSMIHRKDEAYKIQRTAACFYALIAVIVYEAVILLYSVEQLHRMLLAPMIAGVILLSFLFEGTPYIIRQLFIIFTMTVSIARYGGDGYALPQSSSEFTEQEGERIRAELLGVMPDSDAGDRWELGVACLPQFSNMQLMFCFPVYISGSTCTEEYLYTAIDTDTLKSKYIYVWEKNDELRQRCDEKYNLIWSGRGFLLYSR